MTDQQERLGFVLLLLFLVWYFFIRDDSGSNSAGYVPPNYNRANMTSRTDGVGCKAKNLSFINQARGSTSRGHNVITCCSAPTTFKP